METLRQNADQVNPAARESLSAENDVEPMNDVFSENFVSKFDKYFASEKISRNHDEQAEGAS